MIPQPRILRFCFFLLASLLFSVRSQAQTQAPAWESAITLGVRDISVSLTSSSVIVANSVPDGQGNLYILGNFSGTVQLGAFTLVSTPNPLFTNTQTNDIFVAKWSLQQNRYLWVTRGSGPCEEYPNQLVLKGNSLYIAGASHNRTSRTGSITFGPTTHPSGEGHSVFIAKLTDTGTDGVWAWSKVGSNDYLAEVAGLAVSGTSVYMLGDLAGTMSLDNRTVVSNQTSGRSAGDLLLIKLTDAGSTATLNWMQLVGSATSESADAFAVNGNTLYVAGRYFGTTTLGGTTGGTTLPNAGIGLTWDAFVAKFTDSGTGATPVWTQHIGGSESDIVRSMVVNGNNLYLAGDFMSPSLSFGIPVVATLTNPDAASFMSADLFLAKLVDAGTSSQFAWTKQVGGVGSEQATLLLRDGNTLFLAGAFLGRTATFGNTVLTNVSTQTSAGDVYIARFDETSTGATLNWVQRAGSAANDFVNSMHLLGSRLYVQGYSLGQPTFGNITLPLYSSYLATLPSSAVLTTTSTATLPTYTLSPNPANTTVVAHIPAIAGATQATLTLQDGLGRVIRTEKLALPSTGLSHQLSVAGLPHGVYSVHLQAGTITDVRRVVVE